jgi:rSAM/selenodomain-associated transferase 1
MALTHHLVIFARYPSFGSGKTRLAAGAGPGMALRFQRVMLSLMLLRLSHDRRWKTWLAVTPDRSGPWPLHVGIMPQGKGNLGHRMGRIAKRLSRGPVVIVGADCPKLRPEHIARAFRSLGKHDAVFGPAGDGGFWLVGLHRRRRFINPFRTVRWSSEHALSDTLKNLEGHSVALLDHLDDVDDVTDLTRLPDWNVCHAPRHS